MFHVRVSAEVPSCPQPGTGGSGSGISPPSQAQMSRSLWPSHTEGGRAGCGATLMCHLDLGASCASAPATWPRYLQAPVSVIPLAQASSGGRVQVSSGGGTGLWGGCRESYKKQPEGRGRNKNSFTS